MHILIAVLHRPIKPTGVCRYAANLAQCLADRSEVSKVTLVIGEWQTDYFKSAFSLQSSKINVLSIKIANQAISRNFWYLFGLPKLAQTYCPDILHLAFPIPFFRFFFKSPITATIHDLYPYEYPENFGYPRVVFNRFFLKLCINYSDGLACVSQTTLESLRHYFPNITGKKMAVVYNYVDFGSIQPQQPDFIDKNQPFLLCVAQHRKNKNLDILLQSFGLLIQKSDLSTSSQLIIVGSPGPETNKIKCLLKQLGLENCALMVSAINDSELSWLYQHCLLFVIPSSTEGFCIPLAEALYFSSRVVCSNIPIFQEVGSNQCTYFDLQDDKVENLYRAMSQALNEPSQDQSHRGNRFSRKATSDSILELYSNIKCY
jgi:glycosyltransferase involved in cell wall biosynthesis